MERQPFDHSSVDSKWQKKWIDAGVFKVSEDSDKKRRYVLDMFPYPSGAGLHVGHPEGYTATDIVSRYWRMKGEDVLHPMGWDAFGLPTENYAIKSGIHPTEATKQNVATFKSQLQKIGFSYDWDREINTTDPSYYKWTQWFFLLLYKKGLAYRAEAKANWCDSCKTVLANEQVIDGKCERCSHEVIQKDLKQWFFKTTDYADRLLSGLDDLDWSESLKTMQRNWIGRKEGIDITYPIEGTEEEVTCFTTRPDTNFGATFIVLAPEHPFVGKLIARDVSSEEGNLDSIKTYVSEAASKKEIDRLAEGKKKTGVFTGFYAVNGLNSRKLPIWVGDFVLSSVGTGAVVAVPGHDKRDFEFAKEFDLPVERVVVASDGDESKITDVEQVQEEEGKMVNSDFLDGLEIMEAKDKMMDHLEKEGSGERTVSYKLRDWLISRQRYWGAPIPIIYCDDCGEVSVSEDQLPIELPDDVDFKPTGESPLAGSKLFHDVECPACGASGEGVRRESDTMDTFVCSSWYMFRFCDPSNVDVFADPEKLKEWMPVDMYVGGLEHAVGHLLYARFFTMVLKDEGIVDFEEPFQSLRNQGLILAEDGRKMSKRWGNVINPDDVVAQHGADTLRMYEMFMGPIEDAKPWSQQGVMGVRRFVDKAWSLFAEDLVDAETPKETRQLLHQTIKKLSDDIEAFRFNTSVSALMILTNHLLEDSSSRFTKEVAEAFVRVLSPFAPHLAEECNERIGGSDLACQQEWPVVEESLLENDVVTVAVQVNGKTRGTVDIAPDASEEAALVAAKELSGYQKHVDGEPKRVIYVPGRILNVII